MINKYEKIIPLINFLMKNPVVLRENKEYYKLKNAEKELKEFFSEFFAYELYRDYDLIRLYKIPESIREFMGIRNFSKKEEFSIFILVLDFLEELEYGNSILISDVVTHITDFYPKELDWKEYRINQSLIKVLKYAEDLALIKKLDGSEDEFIKTQGESEVLYENTGLSKHLMIDLPIDLKKTNDWKEFLGKENKVFNELQRARRELINRLVIYKEEELYEIIKKNRNELDEEFERFFYADLIVTEEFCYLLMGEERNISSSFPDKRNITLIALLLMQSLENQLVYKKVQLSKNLEEIINNSQEFISKENRNKNTDELLEDILELYKNYEFIRGTNEDEIVFTSLIKHIKVMKDIKGEKDE